MFKELKEEEFVRRAKSAGRTVVFKEFLADRETPVAALSRLGADEEFFLLESVAGGESRGRYSFLGIEPRGTAAGDGAIGELRGIFAEKPFAAAPELPAFQGGAVGYVSYDAAALFEPASHVPREPRTPSMAFLVCDTFIVFDNVRDTATVATVVDTLGADEKELHTIYESAMKRIFAVFERVLSAQSIARIAAERAEAAAAPKAETTPFESEMSPEEFAAIVAECKKAIVEGEVIQIVPSQKFTARTTVGALSLYRALRTVNPSPYNFLMRIGGKALIGSSPEELVKLSGRIAETSPIAGTRPRGATAADDAAAERDLRADAKENAEHVMLVDLGRNDLGRVCESGSVRVSSLARVERYSHVMHLVSTVTGVLSEGLDAFDLLAAAFPAGTLTGAPKIRAMQLLAGLEKSPRGIYGGAAGYFSFTGDMDMAITIRTMVLENGVLTMRAGAGIVADSDPVKEYEETVNKSKAAFEAARMAEELQ